LKTLSLKSLPAKMLAKKYLQIVKISWTNTLVYRLSFILWRLESIILFLGTYLFWLAVYHNSAQISSYNKTTMLTYIIGILILRNLVFSSRINQAAEDIASGGLNKYLVKPMEYFHWLIGIDLGDKIAQLFFLFFELIAIFLIFKPPFFIQTNIAYLIYFLISSSFSILIYFYLSLIISLTTFWYPEHNGWPQRFLFDTMIIFLSGGWFPLDILPLPIYRFLSLLPSTYLRFFPLKIYLGQLELKEIIKGLILMFLWIIILRRLTNFIWQKGLKTFTAVGI